MFLDNLLDEEPRAHVFTQIIRMQCLLASDNAFNVFHIIDNYVVRPQAAELLVAPLHHFHDL